MENTLDRADNFLPRVDEGPLGQNEIDRRIVTLTAPASNAAEQYRSLYYRIERMRERRPLKVIAMASSMPHEGKTITAVNLALTAARANLDRRILLLDADLRRGQVATALGIRSSPGLTELINGDCDLRDVVRRFQSSRLAVIAAGKSPEEPTQILASHAMKEFIRSVKESFDEVYIDLPPTLPFADATILSSLADGVVMVIRANVTPFWQVNQALEQLSGAPMLGCVLNGAEETNTTYVKNYLK
jgi:protein-tyrosine kinase